MFCGPVCFAQVKKICTGISFRSLSIHYSAEEILRRVFIVHVLGILDFVCVCVCVCVYVYVCNFS